jgi:hypothetical protein
MNITRRLQIAMVTPISAAALAAWGAYWWSMTTVEFFGQPGHFTHTVQHQIYPHRAEALWIAAAVLTACGLCALAAAGRPARGARA